MASFFSFSMLSFVSAWLYGSSLCARRTFLRQFTFSASLPLAFSSVVVKLGVFVRVVGFTAAMRTTSCSKWTPQAAPFNKALYGGLIKYFLGYLFFFII